MQRFQKILVATDTRYDTHPVVDNAVEIAKYNGASLTIVDVVPDFSWLVRMSMKDHTHVRELIVAEKQQKLDELTAPIREQGIDVEVKVLCGTTSVEIIREVLRENHDLVMRVAKSQDSKNKGVWGGTGLRLLRKCPCAVWLNTRPFDKRLTHVVGCVDTSAGHDADDEINHKVLELAGSISQRHQSRLSILHAWSIFNEPMIRSRMTDEEFQQLVEANRQQSHELLHATLAKHSDIDPVDAHLLKGDPREVIPTYVEEKDVDLVIMGTVARSGLSGIIMGNTAEMILNQLTCSVLALKPESFVSPIKLD